jgi:hypothetical protein
MMISMLFIPIGGVRSNPGLSAELYPFASVPGNQTGSRFTEDGMAFLPIVMNGAPENSLGIDEADDREARGGPFSPCAEHRSVRAVAAQAYACKTVVQLYLAGRLKIFRAHRNWPK